MIIAKSPTAGINNYAIGTRPDSGSYSGFYFRELTNSSIKIFRHSFGAHAEQIRVRIWDTSEVDPVEDEGSGSYIDSPYELIEEQQAEIIDLKVKVDDKISKNIFYITGGIIALFGFLIWNKSED